jgi:peptidoglycan/xylan/chitin deacetylase (PgdA/CDA1 family)
VDGYGWPHGLMFHRFRRHGAPSPGQGAISEIQFETILRAIGLERILTPREWLARVKTGTLTDRDLCITFDDGLACQYEVALPVLRRLGLKSFWFVFSAVLTGGTDRNEIASYLASAVFPSFEEFAARFEQHASFARERLNAREFADYSEHFKARFPLYSDLDVRFRYIRNTLLSRNEFGAIIDRMVEEAGLTIAEIASCLWMNGDHLMSLHQDDHAIGLHSHSHPFTLANLTPSEQEEEYRTNYEYLRSVTGDAPESMSHPLNSYSDETLEILRRLKITCGFRSNMSVPDGKSHINPSGLEFSRLDSAELLKMTVI